MDLLIPSSTPSKIHLIESPRNLSGEMECVTIEDVGNKRIFHYAQQTGFITNDNEQMRRDNPDWNRNSDFRQVAAIPLIIWNLWESAGITLDQKELRKAIMRHKDEYMTVEKQLI